MKTIPFSPVKRNDRAIEDEEWIKAFLKRAAIGILATTMDSQPYINMRHFVYDEAEGVIFMHGSPTGRTLANIGNNDRVCFSVGEIGRQLPSPSAAGMSSEYASVVVFGRASVVTEQEEAVRALRMLLEKYFSCLIYGEDYAAIPMKSLDSVTVIRIEIIEWSGKMKQADADYSNAFWYDERQTLKDGKKWQGSKASAGKL